MIINNKNITDRNITIPEIGYYIKTPLIVRSVGGAGEQSILVCWGFFIKKFQTLHDFLSNSKSRESVRVSPEPFDWRVGSVI